MNFSARLPDRDSHWARLIWKLLVTGCARRETGIPGLARNHGTSAGAGTSIAGPVAAARRYGMSGMDVMAFLMKPGVDPITTPYEGLAASPMSLVISSSAAMSVAQSAARMRPPVPMAIIHIRPALPMTTRRWRISVTMCCSGNGCCRARPPT
jgi:hypothetical protein